MQALVLTEVHNLRLYRLLCFQIITSKPGGVEVDSFCKKRKINKVNHNVLCCLYSEFWCGLFSVSCGSRGWLSKGSPGTDRLSPPRALALVSSDLQQFMYPCVGRKIRQLVLLYSPFLFFYFFYFCD